jgi:hypothetical protein
VNNVNYFSEEKTMNSLKRFCCAAFFLALLPTAGLAHHSFAAEFIQESATIEGVVTEVWFNAPHIRYYIDVTNEDGSVERWDTRGASPSSLLRRRVLRPDSIEVGAKVVVDGFLGRDGRKLMSIKRMTLDDGTEFILDAAAASEYQQENR